MGRTLIGYGNTPGDQSADGLRPAVIAAEANFDALYAGSQGFLIRTVGTTLAHDTNLTPNFSTEVFDTDSFFTSGNTITIPSGVSHMFFRAGMKVETDATLATKGIVYISKSTVTTPGDIGNDFDDEIMGVGSDNMGLATWQMTIHAKGVLPVSAGDVFKVTFRQQNGSSATVDADLFFRGKIVRRPG